LGDGEEMLAIGFEPSDPEKNGIGDSVAKNLKGSWTIGCPISSPATPTSAASAVYRLTHGAYRSPTAKAAKRFGGMGAKGEFSASGESRHSAMVTPGEDHTP
jgi:hypothetical protein